MSASTRDSDRQVIPRWRDLAATLRHGELGSAERHPAAPSTPDATGLTDRVREFQENRSLSFAADLLSASIMLGVTPATVTAAEVVHADDRSPAMVRDTARWVLGRANEAGGAVAIAERPRDEVSRLRKGLSANPRNAIRWSELSRNYINTGQEDKATRAMRIAVNLAPYDRYILRCAVRLWVHLSDAEQALKTLRNARGAVVSDPWLLASEIATSATTELPSRNIRKGREMMELGHHSSFALSELASALATIEMQAGNRRAKRLFDTALIEPNENSVAQAEWASSRLPSIHIGEDQIEMSPEACARRFAEARDADGTLHATWEWLHDQPFSSDPPIFGSYHASMHRRFEDGVAIAEQGRKANPRDWLLLNNLAFCLASLGRWKDAERVLGDIQGQPGGSAPTLTATRGLVRFRAGGVEDGQRLYRAAIEMMPNPADRLRAEVMMLSEERLAGVLPSAARREEIADAVDRVYPQLRVWLAYLDFPQPPPGSH